ncbi:CheR family methyltransferase [Serpentinicella alkaliphila]|uniref:Chemotaxis protein methyltransferase CheR n=1 Tax=Serpentinicella alkaliphila TaxID=1734049 RepID=A0A4R2THJ6_9FIRM|nr:protein-glutamate O-methyltransferase CheR [Serpentinicella alkaliphila]QUH25400.1 protein-glutamate O-methyltransferase CheR [Serpentinicella alkaliphila]TCQ00605.1 chemotaxis protein methyltransferase CheR [Serpentinicella alkaliphila]
MINKNLIQDLENEDIEIKLLVEGIFLKYGHDFRNYSKAHIKRRILRRLSIAGLKSITEMLYKVLYDRSFFELLLMDFSINVTEMFRDPSFYKALRKEVIPILNTYPFIKIWHAGCATGEEVYSMAILLKEEGLYERCKIYATDFNEKVLDKAKEGIYPIDSIKEYTYNYQQSGGLSTFSDYYMSKYDSVIMDKDLKEKIIFADHNLVTDGVFGEMHIIICRNVLIYFNRELQNNVINLFYESLCHGGILCLGSKESVKFSSCEYKLKPIDFQERIFQKKYHY